MAYELLLASLIGTPAPTAILAGALSLALFAIVGVIVGPNLDGVNAPAIGKNNQSKSNPPKETSNEESSD